MESQILSRRITIDDAAEYLTAVNSVVAERWYLATIDPFALAGTIEFLTQIVEQRWPQITAFDGERVVGWCDIVPRSFPGRTHVGQLGMGIVAEYRGRGLGTRLISDCLDQARGFGFEKVELEVYADNLAACALYRKLDFQLEGVRVKARKIDGRYQDMALMALFLD